MPPRPVNLSSFGLTAPSASSSVDETLGQQPTQLEQLLGKPSQMLDETAKARLLEQALAGAEAAPQPGLLDQLLSGKGIAALLGTAAAGAIGGAPAAAGFGLGALQGAQGAVEAQRSANASAREELSKRLDKANEAIDKSRTRVATLFNTNPEAFVNPKTGEQTMSPDLLGFYVTGEDIPLFATTRRAMDRFDTATANRHTLLVDRLKNASDPQDRRNIYGAIFQNMNFKAPPELLDSLVNTPPNQITTEAANTILKYGGASGMQALIAAGEQHKDPFDPSILSMVDWHDPDQNVNKVTPSDKFLQLADEINNWTQDPNNLDTIRKIREENPNASEDQISLKIANEVLGGRRGDYDTYRYEAHLTDPSELVGVQSIFGDMKKQFSLGIGLSGLDKTPFLQNMTPDEQNAWLWGQAVTAYKAQQQVAKDAAAKQNAGLVNGVATRLQKEYKIGPNDAAKTAKDIAEVAKRRATRPDGTVDPARYEQELRKVTDEVMKGAQ